MTDDRDPEQLHAGAEAHRDGDGEDVGAVPTGPEPGSATTGPARWRWRWPVAALVVVALAGVVGALVVAGHARDQQRRTDATLATARSALAGDEARLVVARAQLGRATAAANADGHALTAAKQQLAQLDTELEATQADVALKGANITDLNACLSGVQQLLNELSVGDETGVSGTLSSVAPSCAAVREST